MRLVILKSLALPTLLLLFIVFVVGMEPRLIYSPLSLSLRYSMSSSVATATSCFLDLELPVVLSPLDLFRPMLSCLRFRSLLFFLLSSVWK